MIVKSNYVAFYCDECDLLEPVIKIFNALHPAIVVRTYSDIKELVSHTNEQLPLLILVYLSKPHHDFMTPVKYLRENVNSDSIPVVIYHHLPEEEELRDLFKKIF